MASFPKITAAQRRHSEREKIRRRKETLTKIERLYTLAEEMQTIAAQLRAADVDVRIRQQSSLHDPLATVAALQITIGTNCGVV